MIYEFGIILNTILAIIILTINALDNNLTKEEMSELEFVGPRMFLVIIFGLTSWVGLLITITVFTVVKITKYVYNKFNKNKFNKEENS